MANNPTFIGGAYHVLPDLSGQQISVVGLKQWTCWSVEAQAVYSAPQASWHVAPSLQDACPGVYPGVSARRTTPNMSRVDILMLLGLYGAGSAATLAAKVRAANAAMDLTSIVVVD